MYGVLPLQLSGTEINKSQNNILTTVSKNTAQKFVQNMKTYTMLNSVKQQKSLCHLLNAVIVMSAMHCYISLLTIKYLNLCTGILHH